MIEWNNVLLSSLLIAPLVMFLFTLICRLKNNINFSLGLQKAVNFTQSLLFGIPLLLFFSKPTYDTELFSWFKHIDNIYTYNIHLDSISLSFLVLVTFLSGIIGFFSNNYLANEDGYYKFFLNFYVMQLALYSLIISSNFYFILISWELLGLSSVFLVSFYQGMKKTVNNALFILGIYKFCDLFLITALLLFHHEQDGFLITETTHNVSNVFLFCLWCASLGKSGQFPFSKWLPRAMEGPTTSSAIFYGALSIHAGLFLLLKFRLFFIVNPELNLYIAIMGAVTLIYALLKSRIQTDVKSTLAYATVAQVGLMYITFSLGFYTLVVFHMASNAILKTYQFLRSPSNIHHFHDLEKLNYQPLAGTGLVFNFFPKPLRITIYQMVYHNFGLTLLWQRLLTPIQSVFSSFQDKVDSRLTEIQQRYPFMPNSIVLGISAPIICALFYIEAYYPSSSFYFTESLLLMALLCSLLSLRHSTIAHYLTYIKSSYFFLSSAALLFFGKNANLDAIAYFITNFFALLILEVFIRYLSNRLALSDIRSYLGIGRRYRYINMLGMLILLLLTFTPGFASFIAFDLVLENFFNKSITLMLIFLAINTLNIYSVFSFMFKIMFGEPPHNFKEFPDFTLGERTQLFLLSLPMIIMGLLPFLFYH